MKKTELPLWASAFVLPLLNLLTAMLVAGLVIRMLGESPVESIGILVANSFNLDGLGYTLFYATTFIFTGLSVSIAMKAGLFNIGTDGQMYIAGLGLTVAMLNLDARLPALLLIPAAMLCSMLFGALWAFLPGYLQAKRGSHIVVTTIMFNFIAANLMNFVIVRYLIPVGSQNTSSRNFADAGAMPRLGEWIPSFADAPLNLSFLLAIVALAVYGIVVWRSPWGYKLRATGLNPNAAHYAGVKISRMIIVAMLISGAFAGLAAVNSILGSTHYLSISFPQGAGFIGIAIALMGRQHPVGIFLSSVLFGALIQGGGELSMVKQNIPAEMFIFIQGVIILFCGAMEHLYGPAVLKLINAKKG
ncbi:MAG: ABC transporter permease [Pseudomonadota bacterium]